MKKKAVLSVSNDLYTDPRVDKVCHTLDSIGYEVLLVGRKYRNSPALTPRIYPTKRLHLFFRKGALFYAEMNIRLFFFLLFTRCDVFVANDLDTLLPNVLASKIRRKKIVYDSHEYFLGLDSIADKPFVKKTWTIIEKYCFPKLKHVITVSQSIANQYEKEYGLKVNVVRNIPISHQPELKETKQSLQLPEDKTIIILQGNAIHRNRGGEELIEAMPLIENAVLIVVGSGDIIPFLKQRTMELSLQDKIVFIDRQSPEKLFHYTYFADIGIAFDKNVSLNHYFSLPNKIFDYIKATTPYLCSNLPERMYITEKYEVGIVLDEITPVAIANAVRHLMDDEKLYNRLKENCKQAATELTWENEEKVLKNIYLNL